MNSIITEEKMHVELRIIAMKQRIKVAGNCGSSTGLRDQVNKPNELNG